jgi:hypothetical protein
VEIVNKINSSCRSIVLHHSTATAHTIEDDSLSYAAVRTSNLNLWLLKMNGISCTAKYFPHFREDPKPWS